MLPKPNRNHIPGLSTLTTRLLVTAALVSRSHRNTVQSRVIVVLNVVGKKRFQMSGLVRKSGIFIDNFKELQRCRT